MALDTNGRPSRSLADRRLLVVVATAVPVWNFYGFAIDFFRDTWGDAPIPVVAISYALNAGFVVLLPFLPGGGRPALSGAALLGSAMAAWSAVGTAFTPVPRLVYAAIPAVLGAATAALAIAGLAGDRRGERRVRSPVAAAR
ncbi:MAG TPA: hypothetical protein VHF24_01250 [Acidimicrobiales bacterium]|nr:hypothetical protein [Acidimicrobiales bacterium]